MKKLVILTIAIVLSVTAFADNKEKTPKNAAPAITGEVIDHETGETLPGVMIKVSGIDKEVFTDLDGQFQIDGLTPGNYNIEISLISYNSNKLKDIKLEGGEKKALKVELKR